MPISRRLGSRFPLGLGCSRLGSVTGADSRESEALIRTALDHGINFFDTSDIYGQGDSERLLGKVLANRSDVVICTKIGKVLSPARRLLTPFKQLIRGAVGSSPILSQTIRRARSEPLPTNWNPAYLGRAIDRSLARLQRERLDIMLLHSPDPAIIRKGVAIDVLVKAKAIGKVGLIGLSVDTVEAAEAALTDNRIDVLQLPVHPGASDYSAIVSRAAAGNIGIIAHEIFGGAASGTALSADQRRQCLASLAADQRVAVSLIGTTKAAHLLEAVDALPTRGDAG